MALLGDKAGAVQASFSFKSSAFVRTLCWKVALQEALRCWAYEVGHVPTELNLIEGAWSRLGQKKTNTNIPALAQAVRMQVPDFHDF